MDHLLRICVNFVTNSSRKHFILNNHGIDIFVLRAKLKVVLDFVCVCRGGGGGWGGGGGGCLYGHQNFIWKYTVNENI